MIYRPSEARESKESRDKACNEGSKERRLGWKKNTEHTQRAETVNEKNQTMKQSRRLTGSDQFDRWPYRCAGLALAMDSGCTRNEQRRSD